MKEIKTDADGIPVWQERFWWKAEEEWWNMICCFEDMWEGIVDLMTNPVWWSIVALTCLPILAGVLLGWIR